MLLLKTENFTKVAENILELSEGLGSSGAECLPNICEALGFSFSIKK